MADDLATLDATAQADLVRRGKASPADLVERAIARIERINPEINAVIHPLFDSARALARNALPDGPFRGVPIAIKDLDVSLAGAPLHCGMRYLARHGYVARESSYFVRRLLDAGFVPVGKANTPELGLTVTTEPLAYGPSRNPWSTRHSTGGSSGGSAAAVASGMVPIAHASDGGGSIRIPASECGLVGLKPSRGRASLGPDYGEYWNGMVANLAVSRTVRDTAAFLDIVSGLHPGDPYIAPPPPRPYVQEAGADPGRLRVGFLARRPGGVGELHPECERAVRDAALALESLGHSVVEAHPGALDRVGEQGEAFMAVVTTWSASALDEWQAKIGSEIGPDDIEPGTRALAEAGRTLAAPRYIAALKWIGRFTREMAAWWTDGFDLLLTPTIAVPPPEIGELGGTPDNPLGAVDRVLSVIPYTPAFNLTGQPAVSLPFHWTPEGLPVGIQLVAAYGREDVLLRVAGQLERARPWRDRRPPIHA